jgi:hypothetical protein
MIRLLLLAGLAGLLLAFVVTRAPVIGLAVLGWGLLLLAVGLRAEVTP